MRRFILIIVIILCATPLASRTGLLPIYNPADDRIDPRVGSSGDFRWYYDVSGNDISTDLPMAASFQLDSSIEYRSSGLWTGIQDIYAEGNYAYCAFINGLMIIDVSDSSLPVVLSQLYFAGGAREVRKLDSLVYVAYDEGLAIINVSDPSSPAIVGRRYIADGITGLTVSDGLASAIMTNDSSNIIFFDIVDPAAPDSMGTINTPGLPWDIFEANKLVYVADDFDAISIIDVTDPANPVIIDSVSVPGIVTGITVKDTLAYVVGDSLWVININTSPPVIIGSHKFEIISGADCISLDIMVRDSLVYVSYMEFFFKFDAHLEIFNVIDPANPVRVGYPENDPTGLFIDNGKAYFIYGFPFSIEQVDRRKGMQIYASEDLLRLPPHMPPVPEPRGYYEPPLSIPDIFIVGDHAYAAGDSSGWYIMNISDPSNPVIDAQYAEIQGKVIDIFVEGATAYVIYQNSGDFLAIFDIAEPSSPVFLDSIHTPGYAYDVFVIDTVAYVADGAPDLTTVNVADPSNPAILDNIEIDGHGYRVFVQDTLVYLADYFNGLAIVNAADPVNLAYLSHSPESWEARDLYIAGDFAYVTDNPYGLRIVDVSDPALPVMRGGYDTPGTAMGVYVQNERAYIADERFGLQLIGVADPDNPVLLDSYDTPGSARGVHASGENVGVADFFSALLLLDTGLPSQVLCGDANADEKVNVGDAVYLINYIFRDGAPPIPEVCHGDINADGLTNVGDAVYIIAYVFREGTPPLEGCCD